MGAPVATSQPKHTGQHGRSEQTDGDTNDLRGLGIREQLELLKKLEHPELSARDVEARSIGDVKSSTLARRVIKTVAALALAIALGWMPAQRLFLVTSAEATVNARVLTLRSPIDGQIVDWRRNSRVGTILHAGEVILRIENPRADRGALDELRRNQRALEHQRQTSDERLVQLERERTVQLAQFNAFSRFRISHIEARRDEIVADKQAATARLEASNASLQRASVLFNRGIQTQTGYDDIVREQKVASAALTAIERRLQAAEIELTAAREGIFVTDGFNDVPRSAQRASELGQMMAEMQATIAEQDRRLASLQSQLQEEADRYGVMSVAVMTSPTDGQIWENLTSPGEDIRRGQDLMRMLDCKATVVTAAVSEANFNKLKIGDKATFRLRGEGEELSGRVVGLHGLAATPANLAINQSTLAREPYHATIEVPALTTGDSCQVGRTGVVTFDITVAAPRAP
jgi:multidrug resistance efflux pump